MPSAACQRMEHLAMLEIMHARVFENEHMARAPSDRHELTAHDTAARTLRED